MTCSIYWCGMTWEAFAILSTGFLVVFGTIVIARKHSGISALQNKILDRQAGISERQTEIMHHQIEIESAGIRAALFDRRFAVYTACRDYIVDALTLRSGDYEVRPETQREIMAQFDKSKFLFQTDIQNEIQALMDQCEDYLRERDKLQDLRQEGVPSVEAQRAEEEEWQSIIVRQKGKALWTKLDHLADVIGEEMRLHLPRVRNDA